MLRIVFTTARAQAMQAFITPLATNPEVDLKCVVSGAEALEAARTSDPHLVIIDSDLPDDKPLNLVQKLLMVNAMVNTAVVSPLSDEEFHEASEGLGVLGRLPVNPGENDAADLLGKLKVLLGVS
ncbi:MAG: response regulator [Desulfobaccales bacterium]